MKPISPIGTLLAALAVPLALTGCGGEGGGISMTNAGTTTPRYSQTLTVTFSGQGLDKGVTARVDGPCSNVTRVAGGTATTVQFSCVVTGVGTITPHLVDAADGQNFGSVKVEVPLPRVAMTVTDGTRNGGIVIELDPRAAPVSVQQFMAYVGAGFYNSTLFHRVRPDTAILGGGYVSDTEGVISAKLATRGDIALEKTGLKNVRGAVAMYRPEGPNSANSMFLINTVNNPRFDAGSTETPDGYAVFGTVVSGLDIVDEVAKVPVRPDLSLRVNDVPVTAVRISAAVQIR